MVSENAEVREMLRTHFAMEAVLSSKVVKEKAVEGIKFKDYYDWQEPAHTGRTEQPEQVCGAHIQHAETGK